MSNPLLGDRLRSDQGVGGSTSGSASDTITPSSARSRRYASEAPAAASKASPVPEIGTGSGGSGNPGPESGCMGGAAPAPDDPDRPAAPPTAPPEGSAQDGSRTGSCWLFDACGPGASARGRDPAPWGDPDDCAMTGCETPISTATARATPTEAAQRAGAARVNANPPSGGRRAVQHGSNTVDRSSRDTVLSSGGRD